MSSVGIQPTSKKQAKPRQPHAAVPLLACRPNAPSVHCMHNIAAPERAGRTPQGCRARAPRAALPLRTCRARQTCVGCPSPSPARRIKCTARAGSCAAGAAATDAAAHFDGALVAEVRVGPARSGLSARSARVRARNLEQLLCNLQHTSQGKGAGWTCNVPHLPRPLPTRMHIRTRRRYARSCGGWHGRGSHLELIPDRQSPQPLPNRGRHAFPHKAARFSLELHIVAQARPQRQNHLRAPMH
jgi:hypothetical protein